MQRALTIGTRGSQLALWQANTVAARIAEAGGPPCTIAVIKTTGDRLQDRSLSEVGGKRLFVKEIEDALLSGEVDLAVHSSKDMPVELPTGLTIAGVLPREDPLDAVVLPQATAARLQADSAETSALAIDRRAVVEALGPSPSIGTGSVRRVSQLTRLFPRGRFEPVRGNVDTRLRKLDEGQYDALVLAAAGLRRLGFAERIVLTLSPGDCVPAPGQGIVAVETRETDDQTRRAVERINDLSAQTALTAERAVVTGLGGGCQTPIGAVALPDGPAGLTIEAVVASLDGSRLIRASARGLQRDAAALGARVARELISQGADAILAEARIS